MASNLNPTQFPSGYRIADEAPDRVDQTFLLHYDYPGWADFERPR